MLSKLALKRIRQKFLPLELIFEKYKNFSTDKNFSLYGAYFLLKSHRQ
jgi:hypothetical protein